MVRRGRRFESVRALQKNCKLARSCYVLFACAPDCLSMEQFLEHLTLGLAAETRKKGSLAEGRELSIDEAADAGRARHLNRHFGPWLGERCPPLASHES